MIFLVVMIQRANRSRVISFKNRITFFDYYWENMKVDMSKVLMSDKKNPEAAKKMSVKIFSISTDTKNKMLHLYAEYCR